MTTPSPFLSDAWGFIKISGVNMPGIIVDVDGVERPYEWAAQKALGTGGAFLLYRGENLAESIKVRCSLTDDAAFKEAEAFNKFISPKKGQRPAAFPVENPAFAWVGIVKVTIKVRPAPKGAGKGNWILVYDLEEYRPPVPIPTGPPDPAKLNGPPKPIDAAEKAIVELLSKIEKA